MRFRCCSISSSSIPPTLLDQVAGDLDRLNRRLFQHHGSKRYQLRLRASPRRRNHQLELILTELGYGREVLVKLRRSVLSFRRAIGLLRERDAKNELVGKLSSFEHELEALEEAEEDLSATTAFMLEGAVGFIGILQSRTINIMTIVGVLLTPPVLVASIYGMNFKAMPELEWIWGYPWALGLMALSGIRNVPAGARARLALSLLRLDLRRARDRRSIRATQLEQRQSTGSRQHFARAFDRCGGNQHKGDRARLGPRLIQLWMVPRWTNTSPARRCTMVPSISISISPDRMMA